MQKILLAIAICLFFGSTSSQAKFLGADQGVVCNDKAVYDASSNGATQVIPLTSGKSIYVCGYAILVGSTATNVSIVYGTGTNCGTGQTALTPAYQFVANSGISDQSTFGNSLSTPNSMALCVKTSAGNPVQVLIRYGKF